MDLRFGTVTKGEALEYLHGFAAELGLDSARMDTFLLFVADQAKRLPEGMDTENRKETDPYQLLAQAREQMLELSISTTADLNRSERRSRALESRVAQLTERMNRDPVTGLGNCAFFDAVLAQEIEQRTKAEGEDGLGLLMIDVDDFKGFNDSFGHLAGDEVLRVVGQALGGTSRAGDVATRIGGDEFAIIVPSATLSSLGGFGERLRRFVEDSPISFGRKRASITLSVGGALLMTPRSHEDRLRLIAEADRQLYLAKEAGRNRVSIGAVVIEGV